MSLTSCREPIQGRIIRTLKEGYWDRTEVIELADGTQRVRKRNKGGAALGPWGIESLRREILYLTTLPASAKGAFPPVLACWDHGANGSADVGYEIPFYHRHTDAGELARNLALNQREIDEYQHELADVVFGRLHEPMTVVGSLAGHMVATIRHALEKLSGDPVLNCLISAARIELNGQPAVGPSVALDRIERETDTLAAIDDAPSVRLHGDLFLENILWASTNHPSPHERRLILIDPVSVAGISIGLPLFDLVKYESYASGELVALRSERVEVSGFTASSTSYRWRIRWEDPSMSAYTIRDWRGVFRRAFEAAHGQTDTRLARLIDGYFSVAMALNTTGLQRQARLLKGTQDLNAVLASS